MSADRVSIEVIAIIPARGDSKRIPRKNLLPIAGRPLLAHSILHARQSYLVREVYVSTEDPEIAGVASANGAEVIRRPPELSGDHATSESALVHALDDRALRGLPDPDLVVFLQCTSPVRRPWDIDRAIESLLEAKADSLFSACLNTHLIWALRGGQAHSVNYNFQRRQREQEMETQFRENGSIYVFHPNVLRECNNRLGGRIAIYEMDYWSSFQLDTQDDVALLEWVLRRPGYAPIPGLPERIELVVFDFDGVMTDNTVYLSEAGIESVRCHRGDGWGISRLREAGISMMVLSTETNPVVAARCSKLKLPCHHGIGDKAFYLAGLLREQGIDPAHVVYVGNDVNDLGCLRMVGVPVAVADADPAVIAGSKVVLSQPGGNGAVRELCDLLLSYASGTTGAPRR